MLVDLYVLESTMDYSTYTSLEREEVVWGVELLVTEKEWMIERALNYETSLSR